MKKINIFNIYKPIDKYFCSNILFEIKEKLKNDLQSIIEINKDIIRRTFDIINQSFSFYSKSLSLVNEIITKELYSFKRETEKKKNNDITIQKANYFSIMRNIKQKSELENVQNTSQLYPINNEIMNSQKFFGEASYNSYPKESNKIQTITDNIQTCSIKSNHIIKFKCFIQEKNIIKKPIFVSKNNNEIKVLENNKYVYINKDLLNSYSKSRAIKKLKKINFITRKQRSSKYRGVSKNGSKWQALIMINHRKCFLGNYLSEDLAARIYDIQAIKNWGIKAKTNFIYDNNQIKKIYNKKINIKCDNISDIMTQIN